MKWQDYIERNPQVMLGKPVFRGTRLTVEFVLQRLGEGATAEELLSEYDGLRQEHLQSAQAYAACLLRNEDLVFQA